MFNIYVDKGVVVSRKAASNYFNGFLDSFYMFYDDLYINNGTISLSTYKHHKNKGKKFDLNSERFTQAVFHYYKFNVMQSSKYFSIIPTKISIKTKFGRCFPIFKKWENSMQCYIDWNFASH